MPESRARVAMAEDDVLLREGLASLLAGSGFDVVGRCSTPTELMAQARQLQPDLVIVDIRMPPTHTTEGLDAAHRIRHELPDTAPTPVRVDGLLAHLIGYLGRADLADDARLRAEAVVLDLLRPMPATPIDVPHAVDERVRVVADALLANPADQRSLEAHARAVGVSRCTLTRLFVTDTGMNFDRWRTQVRLRAALSLLAEGQPVSRVAHAVGYATPSAFLTAFRRTVGISPKRYLNGDALVKVSEASAAADG